ncbi:MAG: nucleotidyltransferase domain-containing protein [Gemmatimonadetes bacterium]|nr:nucleotidyltransferase domain-containing protein [Gemmatimonadota bacterium]
MIDMGEERTAYTEALQRGVERLRRVLADMPEVRRVVLFGSYAAGRRDLATDLDVLVEMDSQLDFVMRTARLHQKLSLGVDLDLLVYTPAELAAMPESGLARRALAEGEVIYERDAAR